MSCRRDIRPGKCGSFRYFRSYIASGVVLGSWRKFLSCKYLKSSVRGSWECKASDAIRGDKFMGSFEGIGFLRGEEAWRGPHGDKVGVV